MFSSWHLKTKIILGVMAVNIAGMLVVAGAFIYNNLELLDSRLESRITTELELLSKSVAPVLESRDKKSANKMLATLSMDPAIISASLYVAGENESLAAYYFLKNDRLPGGSRTGNFVKRKQDVFVDGEVRGQLVVVMSQEEIETQSRHLFLYSVSVLTIAVLLVLIGALRLQKMITGPIVSLNRLSQEVARTRDYSLRSTIDRQDEIGELSKEFNRMLAQVQNRDVMLEKQVQQRTAELEKLAEEFRHRAFHDSLTWLPNRAYLNEFFDSAATNARRTRMKMLMLLLDLDNFKTINDSLGHNVGDELLKTVARDLRSSLRECDTIVRLGGDEFIVLITHIDECSDCAHLADTIASKIIDSVQGESKVGDHLIHITASIGGSIFPDHGKDLVTLKRSADIAMYNAKNQGRNQFSLFEQSMEHFTRERLVIQNDLRQALKEEQLRLVYQPKIDARNDMVIGCEALVRWEHPTEGLLSPAHFIAFAEENGMVRDIDYYVLERACLQARLWRDIQADPIKVAVNLSAAHFADHAIVAKIRDVLQSTQLAPENLEVEITEAMLINNPEIALDVLLEIRKLGVCVSLDDFGVGYSSLSYLRTLPVDIVKLDRSFIQNILTNPHDARLTRGIIALTRGLGLDVLAEGIETEEQEKCLLDIGCYLMQGYLYLRPCTALEFVVWLQDRQWTSPKAINNQ